MTGSLVIMAAMTCANMRRGVLLHKLILLEVAGLFHDPNTSVARAQSVDTADLGHGSQAASLSQWRGL